jgi:hypothetical protein
MSDVNKNIFVSDLEIILRSNQSQIIAGDSFNVIFKGMSQQEAEVLHAILSKKSAWSADFALIEANFIKKDDVSGKYWLGTTMVYQGGIKELKQQLIAPHGKQEKGKEPNVISINFEIPSKFQANFIGDKIEQPKLALIEVAAPSNHLANFWKLHKPWIISVSFVVLILGLILARWFTRWFQKRKIANERKVKLRRMLDTNQTREDLEKIFKWRAEFKANVDQNVWSAFETIMNELQFAPAWSEADLKRVRQSFMQVKESYRD